MQSVATTSAGTSLHTSSLPGHVVNTWHTFHAVPRDSPPIYESVAERDQSGSHIVPCPEEGARYDHTVSGKRRPDQIIWLRAPSGSVQVYNIHIRNSHLSRNEISLSLILKHLTQRVRLVIIHTFLHRRITYRYERASP
jgi:hypothetical protein